MHFYNLVPIFFLSITPDNCNQINTNDACVNPKKKKKRKRDEKPKYYFALLHPIYANDFFFKLGWGKEGKVTKRVD